MSRLMTGEHYTAPCSKEWAAYTGETNRKIVDTSDVGTNVFQAKPAKTTVDADKLTKWKEKAELAEKLAYWNKGEIEYCQDRIINGERNIDASMQVLDAEIAKRKKIMENPDEKKKLDEQKTVLADLDKLAEQKHWSKQEYRAKLDNLFVSRKYADELKTQGYKHQDDPKDVKEKEAAEKKAKETETKINDLKKQKTTLEEASKTAEKNGRSDVKSDCEAKIAQIDKQIKDLGSK